MRAVLRPCGDRAILIDLDDEDARRALDAHLRARRANGWMAGAVVEQVPAARTVLLRLVSPGAAMHAAASLRELLPGIEVGAVDAVTSDDEAVVPVRYDGEDLPDVAAALGVTPEELVAWHTARPWLVDFSGFMPGFGYLVREGDGHRLDGVSVPRRSSPRTRIPAGSVALAGPWTGIYPSASSGGWQLIGTTDLRTWDLALDPPAVLRPGRRIRFEAITTAPAPTGTDAPTDQEDAA